MAEYIEREAAIKCAEESYKMWCLTMSEAEGAREINKCYKMQELCKAMGEMFKIIPSADVAPAKHGKWIEYPRPHYFKCSECNHTVPYVKAVLIDGKRKYNYCPGCGAKMGGGEREDNA